VPLQEDLAKYAELTVKVGLNVQPDQRLVVRSPIEAVDLVRAVSRAAYDVGCRYVDVLWADEQLQLIRFEHAPRDSFSEFPDWRVDGLLACAKSGDAFLSISGNDPDLLKGQDADLISLVKKTEAEKGRPFGALVSRSAMNWCVTSAAVAPWAARVFPDLEPGEQLEKLWDAIFSACRVDQEDPTAAWQVHIKDIERRRAYLNVRAYDALHYAGPGTDLTVGLPRGHLWCGAAETSAAGTTFTPNIPTEEVFTMPHCRRVDGRVASTKPLNYGGSLIENFSLTFSEGRVVAVQAEANEAILRKLVETDEGAGRLGEIALVPDSSPISQTGILFYNTLFDENASSHVALGRAYSICVEDGAQMEEAALNEVGGNTSVIHVDFMIGSKEMDIDGVSVEGVSEAVMREGEWAFDV
jgi:aminopeptidase